MTLQTLPLDIIIEICKHLKVSDINSLYYTSSSLRSIIKDNSEYIYSSCQHNKPHGIFRTWWDNENTIPRSELSYLDGNIQGECRRWYSDGQISEYGLYNRGMVYGEYKRWYTSGQINEHYFYIDGKKNGNCKLWYNNGNLRFHGFYIDGKLDGECKQWYTNGKLYDHSIYVNGIWIKNIIIK